MFPVKLRKWIKQAIQLDRRQRLAEQLRRQQQCQLKVENLELRLVPSITATGTNPSFTETNLATVVVANFTDTTPSPAANYQATIDWGDGFTSAGTVSGATGNYAVTGSHAYTEDGSSPITVVINETGDDNDTGTATGTASIAEGSFILSGTATLNATEGQSFTGTVATFSDPGSPDAATAFAVSIDWGDGTTSSGTVTGSGGSFTVGGAHTYTDEQSSNINVTVTEPGANFTIGPNPDAITVAEGDVLSGTAATITATEGAAISGAVATFSNSGYPGNTAADFTATIDWGDGATTTGTVSGGSGTAFTVSGTHTYADEGSFTPTVTLTDNAPGTASATATGVASEAEGDSGIIIPATITSTEGQQFSGTVLSFTDEGNPSQVASDWTATIDWGDGTTTAGTVSGSTGGPFTVLGAHTYADEGSFTVSVLVADDAPSALSFTGISTAVVAEADVLSGSAAFIFQTEGNQFSGSVATFTNTGYPGNPASDFTATIDWGDGTTTAGTVSGSNGFFSVSGSHTYADEGTYLTSVTVTDDSPGTASTTATGFAFVAEADTLSLTASSFSATEGASFSGAVASFSDTGYPGNTASDFTATIDWGDNTTTSGTVSGSNGFFTISGTHTYTDEGTYFPTVTLADDLPSSVSATATGVAVVSEGDVLAGTGLSITPTENSSFSGAVATFSDTGFPDNSPSDFTASINWGDGTTTTGTVSGSAGQFTVSGQHTYVGDETSYATTVTLTDDSPGTASATATGTATVVEGDVLAVTAVPYTVTEGHPLSSVTVATFTTTNVQNVASDFGAQILWGDGTSSDGTVTGSNGNFTVTGSHFYADEGLFSPTVFVSDDAPGTATASAVGTATVVEGDVLVVTGADIGVAEGTNFNGVVSTFIDTGYPSNPASDFTATIDWGDGTTTAGTVLGGGGGNFTITGTHIYADEGTYNTTVTLTDDAPGTAVAISHGVANVTEADTLSLTASSFSATEGSSFNGAVATFSDTGYPGNSPSDFTATIDWGDGTTTVGTVSGSDGFFTVSGSHTYADEGTHTTTVTLTDDTPGTASATATGLVTVAEGDVLNGSGLSVTSTEGSTFSGAVATFSNTGYPGNPASDFTATIDWGDGTTTTGTVSGSSGFFTVSGTHSYTDEGSFTTTVTLTDDAPGTASATATGVANVAEADVLSGTASSISTTEGNSFSGQVATFSNIGNPGNPATDFTATIDWGDGTTDVGTVSGTSGFFTVSGTHTYADEGTFTTKVILTDDAPGTASATASGVALVAEGDVLSGTGISIDTTEGSTYSGTLATFSDTNTSNTASDFAATIDWGDGTTTTGTVSGTSGFFTVSGTHTYADEGRFTPLITLSDDAPGTASASASAVAIVEEGDVLTPTGIFFTGTEGYLFSGAVASFTNTGYPNNPAGDFTATIDWGDGTTTVGIVTGGSGVLNVSGNHLYTTSATFNVKVTLVDDEPGTATATASSTATIQEQLLAVGTGAGQQPLVHVYDSVSHNLIASFDAFDPHFLGGVSVAVGDVNGDGVPDIIVAAGPGGGPHVKIIDGTKLSMVDGNGEIDNAALLGQFYAYNPFFGGGVFVAFGVSTGGLREIITGAGASGGPHVKVIDGSKINQLQGNSQIADSALVAQFYAYSPFFNGGVRVAAADLNGDGVLDIVTGAGPGGGPHVKAIDGSKLNQLQANGEIADSALLGSFYAYTPTAAPSGGVYVAAITIGGKPVIVTGDGSAADGSVDGPLVKVIDATKLNLLQSNGEISNAALLGRFFAYDPTFLGGVTVGAEEIDGDTAPEIITGAGPGGGPHVKVIDGNQLNNLQPNMEISNAALLDSFYAFSPFFNGGVFVGAGT